MSSDGGGDWYERLHAALLRGEKGAADWAVEIARTAEWAGPDAEIGTRFRRKQSERGRRGRETIADRVARDRAELAQYVTEYAAKLGTDSPSAIARAMLQDTDNTKPTRKEVDRLRSRIRRAVGK